MSTRNLTKHFGGVRALEEVSLDVDDGEIRGLIGPNGSGKTTFLNLVMGLLPVTHGSIYFRGIDITGMNPHAITKKGIACTFQIPRIVPDMTCLENVMLGSHCRTGLDFAGTFLRRPFKPSRQEESIRQQALQLLDFVNLGDSVHRWTRDLSWVEEELLQVARALATEPKLLLLDEPTAGMGDAESGAVQRVIKDMQMKGVTCIVIAHDMRLIMGICDKITVLNFGKKIAEGKPTEIQNNNEVLEIYIGTE